MSDEDEEECKCPPPGAPLWLATFADLMSLLMCFFVLLLSFSELNVQRYRAAAGSMKEAFGVQRVAEDISIPKGISIIAQEFSPGRPDPTPALEVRQQTDDDTRQTIRTYDALVQQTVADARRVAEMMVEEIKTGKVDVETIEDEIIIRIREQGSFGSGSAELDPSFYPVIEKIRMVLAEVEGDIEVSGHTDDIPIETKRFRSNWELSSSRAVSVAHGLLDTGELDSQRFTVKGYADTAALTPNVDAASRRKNRRVEIIIQKSEDGPQESQENQENQENQDVSEGELMDNELSESVEDGRE